MRVVCRTHFHFHSLDTLFFRPDQRDYDELRSVVRFAARDMHIVRFSARGGTNRDRRLEQRKKPRNYHHHLAALQSESVGKVMYHPRKTPDLVETEGVNA